jgi:hypothetical protein
MVNESHYGTGVCFWFLDEQEIHRLMGNLKGTAYRTETYLRMKTDRLFRWRMKTKTKLKHIKQWFYSVLWKSKDSAL